MKVLRSSSGSGSGILASRCADTGTGTDKKNARTRNAVGEKLFFITSPSSLQRKRNTNHENTKGRKHEKDQMQANNEGVHCLPRHVEFSVSVSLFRVFLLSCFRDSYFESE